MEIMRILINKGPDYPKKYIEPNRFAFLFSIVKKIVAPDR